MMTAHTAKSAEDSLYELLQGMLELLKQVEDDLTTKERELQRQKLQLVSDGSDT